MRDFVGKAVLRRWSTLPYRHRLDRLALAYRTDKSSSHHGYTEYYARHLPTRHEVRALLEIGIGGTSSWDGYDTSTGGMSLRMWRDYYPRAEVIGLDIHEKDIRGPRITTVRGSQDDPAVLAGLIAEHGPFDVVVDDGSHVGRHQVASFDSLFMGLRPGGVYVIEDLDTAYSADYEGGPPGTGGTAVELLKRCLDEVHLRREGDSIARPISAVHVYAGIAFIVRETEAARS